MSLRYEPRIDARSYQVTGFECAPHREEMARGRMSSGSFMSVGERERFVAEALEVGDAEPTWLELELAEGALLEAERDLAPTLHALRAMGAGFELADFGATRGP